MPLSSKRNKRSHLWTKPSYTHRHARSRIPLSVSETRGLWESEYEMVQIGLGWQSDGGSAKAKTKRWAGEREERGRDGEKEVGRRRERERG